MTAGESFAGRVNIAGGRFLISICFNEAIFGVLSHTFFLLGF